MKIVSFTFADALDILPKRDPTGNKGTFGTLTAVCGSAPYRGAARLAVSAALRCGAGIVRLAAPECVIAACAAKIDECIYLVLPETGRDPLPDSALSALAEAAERSDALLAGCGLGDTFAARSVVETLARNSARPVVLDADALNCLRGDPSPLDAMRGRSVITPHIGEFARLTGKTIAEIKAAPAELASEFASRFGCVVVLKDFVTHIAAPGSDEVRRCGAPNSGLAKGGSGDVLAGMIASFLTQGLEPGGAAAAGCALHAEAALRCAARLGERAMLPSDLIAELPYVFTLRNGERGNAGGGMTAPRPPR